MTDEQLKKLLRLKQYERPRNMDAFTDDLLGKLHDRQREDYLRQSSFSLLMDHIATFFESITAPQKALAAAAAMALLVGGILLVAPSRNHRDSLVANDAKLASPAAKHSPDALSPDQIISPGFGADRDLTNEGQRMGPLLLKTHFDGGFADEANDPSAGEAIQYRMKPRMEMMPILRFDDPDPIGVPLGEGPPNGPAPPSDEKPAK